MSYLERMPLEKAIPIVKRMYSSFGLKSFILLKNKEWINVTTVIDFTRRSTEDLTNEYRSLQERIGRLDFDYLKLILQPRPIDEISKVIEEIRAGHLAVGDLDTKLLSEKIDLTKTTIGSYGYFLRVGEYLEYKCCSAILTMDKTPQSVLSQSEISPLKLSVPNFNDLFRSWMGLENSDSTINVVFIFPIYTRVIGVKYIGGNEIEAILKIHRKLLDDSVLLTLRKAYGDRAPILERKGYPLNSFKESIQEDFAYITIRHKFSALNPDDTVQIQIIHSELGSLDDETMRMRDFTAQTLDSFSQAFNLFEARKRMEQHLFEPKSALEFEASVSWLLELAGIMAVRLNKQGKGDETLKENGIQRGSADILAYNLEYKLLVVIDCTTGVPTEIDRIRNTAEYISRKLSCHASPLIISSVDALATKDQAEKYGIRIIDKSGLKEIMIAFEKGEQYRPLMKRLIFGVSPQQK